MVIYNYPYCLEILALSFHPTTLIEIAVLLLKKAASLFSEKKMFGLFVFPESYGQGEKMPKGYITIYWT